MRRRRRREGLGEEGEEEEEGKGEGEGKGAHPLLGEELGRKTKEEYYYSCLGTPVAPYLAVQEE